MNFVGELPKFIVFDLDYTLWPFYVDTHVTPPFKDRQGTVVDKHGSEIELYKDVIEILEWFKSRKVKLGLASRTCAPHSAKELIKLFNIERFFQYQEIYPGCKKKHFQSFVKNSKIAYSEMIFFDDEERNILDIKQLGVNCLHVPDGITIDAVKRGLELYSNNHSSKP